MIWQCYFLPDHRGRLFDGEAYWGFGLDPIVNPDIVLGCPELADAATRLHLCEFAAMLWSQRNNPSEPGRDWIGFTSWRQTDKTPWRFRDATAVEAALAGVDAAAWGRMTFGHPLAVQAEEAHPGLTSFMVRMMHDVRGGSFSLGWLERPTGFFASYWAMRRPTFRLFMADWMTPAIQFCLDRLTTDPYLTGHPRAASYALERVFCAWAAVRGRAVRDCPAGRVWRDGAIVEA